jgi:transcriptional regulator GlxA family with amidase domain
LPEQLNLEVEQIPHTLPAFAEPHYSVEQLAEFWNISHDTVTRLFREEPGVFAIAPKRRKGRRTRVTLRIPEHVAARVYASRIRRVN